MTARSSSLLRATRPPIGLGLLVAAAAIASTTAVLYALREVAPSISLGVVYLLGVLLVSTVWGFRLGMVTAFASAAAFNFFHIPPTGRFTVADGEHWVALVVFLVAATVASTVADLARSRAVEAELRRREADLGAELARVILGTPDLSSALGPAAQRIAQAFGLASAAIVLDEAPPPADPRRRDIAVRSGGAPLGPAARTAEPGGAAVVAHLQIPADAPPEAASVLEDRIAPVLAALLAAALERAALTREVVETSALRRSDEIKTAVLRAVSHDLRSPLTAIITSAAALASETLEPGERRELAAAVTSEAERLAGLVEKLLDLSRLQAGSAPPRPDWVSLDEVLQEAVAGLGDDAARVKLSLDAGLPLLEADAAQLERAFANLLENALRHSAPHPVSVRARVSGGRLLVRVVDRGQGIPLAEQERIFEPFYQGRRQGRHGAGSGLGLAIVRGCVEANGGTVAVESLPGQGTTFVVRFPLPPAPPAPAAAPTEPAAAP